MAFRMAKLLQLGCEISIYPEVSVGPLNVNVNVIKNKAFIFLGLLICISFQAAAQMKRSVAAPKEFPFVGRLILSFDTRKIANMGSNASKEVQTAFAQAKSKGYDFFISNCSVTLIAPNIALTAAHCVMDWPVNKSFNGMLGNGIAATIQFPSSEDAVTIDRVIFSPNYNALDSKTEHWDWALLYLKQPVEDIPPVAMLTESRRFANMFREETFTIVAYDGEIFGSGLPHRDMVRDDCKNTKGPIAAVLRYTADYRIFVNDCKVVSGNSGGPLFVKINNKLHLVGVLSSTTIKPVMTIFPMVSITEIEALRRSFPQNAR